MDGLQRLRVTIRGAVQGVGFRPFVYKLATAMDIKGWVINSSQGVFIEAEQLSGVLNSFLVKLEKEKPPHSYIQSLESSFLDPVGFKDFEIRKSDESGEKSVLILPDIATCSQCLEEVFDPTDRRYLYPFTNCTLCGPRYSIIESLPYDRPGTSMKDFPMCPDCQREYDNPDDRRFHAQPNACPKCGPQVYAADIKGNRQAEGVDAFHLVVDQLSNGAIAAVKGLGGFHLMVDARNGQAIGELRTRKRRSEKPLAVMFPTLETVKKECQVSEIEQRLLLSSESPIVLLDRIEDLEKRVVSLNVAPGNPTLGVMLPYTPLHHILLKKAGFPLVATSGNLSDEPICITEDEALERLKDIADLFLFHNRPIQRHVDDSVVRVVAGREMILRRSRGYAPLPIPLSNEKSSRLAVGAHQKNAIGFQIGKNAFISQHIGDLETEPAYQAFEECISSLKDLYEVKTEGVVYDYHSDYLASKYAEQQPFPGEKIQHHHAHIASCMAENQIEGNVLGVSWDGTGAGLDDMIWGGEFLIGNQNSMQRLTHLRPFKLPGSSQAVKESRRSALGLLFEIFGEGVAQKNCIPTVIAFDQKEFSLIIQMLALDFNSPVTTSAGRLFDAISSIIGIRQVATFEGQGAMELEFLIKNAPTDEFYPFVLAEYLDWEPMVLGIIDDLKNSISVSKISAKFHNTLVEMILNVAQKAKQHKVVISGGCFQNRYLTERTINRLKQEGFNPYWHQRVPPNDGGIALGQLYASS